MPAFRLSKTTVGFALAVAAVAVGAYLRVFEIDTRPPHSDESVNFLFVETTNRLGYYPYSHENYHGPLFFYLITGIVNWLGDDLMGLRLGAVLSGVVTLALIFGFSRLSGLAFCVFAAALAALSPSMIFFSRYAIHESMLVLGTLGFALSLYWWTARRSAWCWYGASLALWVLVATKETFTIAVFCVGLAMLSLGDLRELIHNVRCQWKHVFFAYLLFAFLTVFTYTGGMRWPDGIGELFLAIPQWIGRSNSDVGHFKPWRYYLSDVVWPTEPALIAALGGGLLVTFLSALLGIIRGSPSVELFGRHARLARFLAVWTILATVVYSLVPYKTVWLIINLTFPAQLFAACILAALWERTKIAALVLFVAIAGSSVPAMLKYNFVNVPLPGASIALASSIPYGPKNPFSYVHTSPGTLELVKTVTTYWEKNPEARVLVGIEGYFPLPYYFRHKATQCAYMRVADIAQASTQFDIMILDHHKDRWTPGPEWVKKYNRLSDYAEADTYFRAIGDFPAPDSPSTP